jgi:sigma-B regulation protein RsbU (phosphoserine phosphatase)
MDLMTETDRVNEVLVLRRRVAELESILAAQQDHAVEGASRLASANQKLLTAEEDLRIAAVAFETSDSVVITDHEGRILRVNRGFTKASGFAPEDVIGRTPRVLRSGRHDDAFYRNMWRKIRADGLWEGEIWNQRKDGRLFLQRLTITCVTNESGAITHYVADGRDITKQRQSEEDHAAIQAARTVQRALFPAAPPVLSGFEISGAVHPAQRVSGDFFDYIPMGRNSVCLLVADVSGHGLGPSLLMAKAQAYLRALSEAHTDPGDLLTHANRLFGQDNSGHFVTMFLGRLDADERTFVYAGAGHAGYHILANGDVKLLEPKGLPLGVVPATSVASSPAIHLQQGDIILLPTDGIEEARNRAGHLFDRRRMFEITRDNRERSAAEIIEALFRAARHFTDRERQQDDITAVVIKAQHSN